MYFFKLYFVVYCIFLFLSLWRASSIRYKPLGTQQKSTIPKNFKMKVSIRTLYNSICQIPYNCINSQTGIPGYFDQVRPY
jgi:hypothetical protein